MATGNIRPILWKLFITNALIFAASILTSIRGPGLNLTVSQTLVGGHTLDWGINRSGYFKVVSVQGVLDPDAHTTTFVPPPIGFDWSFFPGIPPLYPPETTFRMANWFAGVPFGLIAAWSGLKYRRLNQQQTPSCPICHYDLRAHKPSQQCPECGTPIPRFGWRSKPP